MADGKTLALKNFNFVLKLPEANSNQFVETRIETDLTIQPGQKLVVGKLASANPQNAIFLIVTADVQ